VNGLRLLIITLVAFAIPPTFGQTPTTLQQKSAPTPPALTVDQADITVTEVSTGVYSSSVLRAGVQIGQIKVDSASRLVLDNSTMFIDKRIIFMGDIKEYVREVDGLPATSSRPRIVTAAHRDYNPLAAASSLGLSEVGVVDVDANGFVRSPNAKSGWVNRSVTVGLQDGGESRFIKLSNVTFWIGAGGQEWLALSVGSASVSDDEKAPGSAINVLTSVAGGKAFLRVGQHRLRLVLPALTDKLGFVDENQVTLNESALDGDLERVRALLKGDPDLVFSKDTYGATPLEWAAGAGHKEVAELLLANRADVNAKNNIGSTPLHSAAANGHSHMAELLLANRADVNAKNNNGATPLHYAAANGRSDMAELLLNNKADVNARANKGATPLHFAMNKDVAELLLANGADLNAKDNNGETPLHYAAANGHSGVAELLINNKADINVKDNIGTTPLQLATTHSHEDVAELLRHYGGRNLTREMLDAAREGDLEKVKALLKDDPDLVFVKDDKPGSTDNGWTPLHYAAFRGHKDVVELLLANKAPVNAMDEQGGTPLFYVRGARGYKDIEKLLRRYGGM